MPTVRSSTDPLVRGGGFAEAARAVADVRPLLAFRLAGLRGRSRRVAPVALGVIALITLLSAVVPAFVTYDLSRQDVLILLPSAYVGVLVISIVSAATSGGGRELLPREQAIAFPVSPTTDHLGALLMAPLNIAWLLQCWAVLGATSYAVGPQWTLLPALVPVLLWLVTASTTAQMLAWCVEWVRRGPYGAIIVRAGAVAVVAVIGTLIATSKVTTVLDNSPTVKIAVGVASGMRRQWGPWFQVVAALALLSFAALCAGAWLAGRVARRAARDELRVEASARTSQHNPRSDFAAMLRTDRAGIWRSVPMRRGLTVLALFPGLVAVGGSFHWDMLGIFPGLVASGGALLFGVNAWCLDGRGALWRDSLPVSPRLAFASRAVVLLEILLAACTVTLLLASVRVGVPTLSELLAVVCAAVVVTTQVVATSLRWSVRRPYAVDLRSSRATPAPPLVMVGYSSRLALTTTFTGLLFNLTTQLSWYVPLLFALPFLAWSGVKLLLTARAWSDPPTRSRVIATVAS